MSYYVHGSNLSYLDYLQAKNFVSDLGAALREAGRGVALAVSRQTREVIASNEVLARENIQVMEASAAEISGAMEASTVEITGVLEASTAKITGALNDGFERLSYDMGAVSDGISELNATFHWGFGKVIAELGHMNDTLETLVEIAKTPVQTVAFNHFEIARDAFRQGLYPECLEELDKAIAGDHTSSGYKMEWRFHQMKGTLELGFAGGDLDLVDLAAAENSFYLAARYARSDYPKDAARAALSAGWAAYCQGKLIAALEHTEQAISLDNKLGEAFFQAAKVKMALGEVDAALPILSQAMVFDRFYVLKAAGDGDFQPHDERLREFIEALCREKYSRLQPMVETALEKFTFFRRHFPEAREYEEFFERLEALSARDCDWPLVDLLEFMDSWEKNLAELKAAARFSLVEIPTNLLGGFREVEGKVDELYNVWGEKITTSFLITGPGGESFTLQFCTVPAGTFTMGDGDEPRRVNMSRDFLMGRFPVTQAQWQAVMGNNPSKFTGSDRPVETVSWGDCQEFIKKLNAISGKSFRLPTEAEWEYACRAGSETSWYFGDDESKLGEFAWFDANSEKKTHTVGEKKPNAWGLYDMHGNVWEWCQDLWKEDLPGGSFADPQGPSSGLQRVRRGGGWSRGSANVRAAYRVANSVTFRNDSLGFRLMLSAGQE